MSQFPHPVDATLHGTVDYAAGASLTTVLPRALGLSGTRSARQIRTAGAIHAGYSAMTDYPLGIVKVLPFQAHLALDALGALALAATPFVTGQFREGPKQWMPHVGLCLFELASLAVTDPTGRGDFHGDIQSLQGSNREDPRRKISDPRPAMKPHAAKVAAARSS
jgi:hypothetical protein